MFSIGNKFKEYQDTNRVIGIQNKFQFEKKEITKSLVTKNIQNDLVSTSQSV